jgi:hypothetical protein
VWRKTIFCTDCHLALTILIPAHEHGIAERSTTGLSKQGLKLDSMPRASILKTDHGLNVNLVFFASRQG